jgi:hypothetical protein
MNTQEFLDGLETIRATVQALAESIQRDIDEIDKRREAMGEPVETERRLPGLPR